MNILYFCPRWGSEQIPWQDWLLKIRDAGYDGIEWAIDNNTSLNDYDQVFNHCVRLNIPVIAQHYSTNDADFNAHFDNYEKWWRKIRPYPVLKINSQTGKDYFSMLDNQRLITLATEYAGKMKIPIVHETHRGKFSFAAHITRQYLNALPDLRITLDASHWVNVAESLLEDQGDTMQLAISRTDHIHARIGFPEGPQVHDPRAPFFEDAKLAHFNWWDAVVAHKQQRNETLTITTEFGPWPYMVHDPNTRQPLASQWDVNVFMLETLRKRYG